MSHSLSRPALSLGTIFVLVWLAVSCSSRETPAPNAAIPGLAPAGLSGFARAAPGRSLEFPVDHGPHPDYQTEWWYYTGNLQSDDGRHFGFQLTFFRRAVVPPGARPTRTSQWAADQVYMAHFALTDVSAGQYRSFERFARGAAGLSGARGEPYRVWVEDWYAEELTSGDVRLKAAHGDAAVELTLRDSKGITLQGDQGYSQKGPELGNASHYYSFTRLEASGTVGVAERDHAVSGQVWMDHEFSTSALASDQVGWDWFALQLDDNSELMVFQIRKEDGSVDPFSSGTFVGPDREAVHLGYDDFQLSVRDTWRSPRSGAIYPARWDIHVSEIGLKLQVAPYLSDQELDVSYVYWEGAVRVAGERDTQPVSGSGYVEMTGYAGSMRGQF